MKAVLLAGGYGTRIAEESNVRPKPMVEIGGMPILWHIMKIYAAHGIQEFVICCGYKSNVIKDFFNNYFLYSSDVTFDFESNSMETHSRGVEPWRVTLVETGERSLTGGRLRRVRDYVGDETFCFTYGDCVSDVDVTKLVDFHKSQDVLATLTAIQPPGRFGALSLTAEQEKISSFTEKPRGDGAWVNGGFFVLEPAVLDYIDGDEVSFEREPLERLADEGQLAAFKHTGYWQNLDTLRDKMVLEERWAAGDPPWRVWA